MSDEEDETPMGVVWGGGESLKEQKEMWGGRASRALDTMNGKSTGRTSLENEMAKKQLVKDEREREKMRNKRAAEKAVVGVGLSRASLKRKKRKGEALPVAAPSQSEPSSAFRARLESFYRRYAPEKIAGMGGLLQKFASNENDLFDMLVAKYGKEPTTAVSDELAAKADEISDEYDKLQRRKKREEGGTTVEREKKKRSAAAPIDDADSLEAVLDSLNAQNVNFFLQQVRQAPGPRENR